MGGCIPMIATVLPASGGGSTTTRPSKASRMRASLAAMPRRRVRKFADIIPSARRRARAAA